MSLFPVKKLSVITGAEGSHEPISAIHPNAIDQKKNDLIAAVITEALGLTNNNQVKQDMSVVKQKKIKQERRKTNEE